MRSSNFKVAQSNKQTRENAMKYYYMYESKVSSEGVPGGLGSKPDKVS